MRPEALMTKVHGTGTVPVQAKSGALPVPEITVNHSKEPMVSDAKKKRAEPEVERQKFADKLPVPDGTVHMNDQKEVARQSTVSSGTCDAINKKLIELYEFTIMVKNTSAFHLQEKGAALSVPGITVSNNKKKMLQDAEKKGVELLAEREKQGCGTSTK